MLLLVEAWSYFGTAASGYMSPPTVGSWGAPGRRFGAGGGLPSFPAGHRGLVNCELDFSRHRRRSGPGVRTQPRGRIVIAFADGHVEIHPNDDLADFTTATLTGRCIWSSLDR